MELVCGLVFGSAGTGGGWQVTIFQEFVLNSCTAFDMCHKYSCWQSSRRLGMVAACFRFLMDPRHSRFAFKNLLSWLMCHWGQNCSGPIHKIYRVFYASKFPWDVLAHVHTRTFCDWNIQRSEILPKMWHEMLNAGSMADHLDLHKSLLVTACGCFLLGSFSSTGIASGMSQRELMVQAEIL